MNSDKEWFENQENHKIIQEAIDPGSEAKKAEEKALLEKSKNGFINWEEMMNLPHEENNYLIDKFLWEGQVAMILAKEKVGKSILSKQMICSLTSGEALFDEYDVARKCNICYLQLEGDRGETKTRFKSMTQAIPVGKERFFWRFYDKLHLDTVADTERLLTELRSLEKQIDVIFIDPVYMACSGSLSNDEPVRNMIGNIRKVQEEFNCAVILVHHEHRPTKDQSGRYVEEGDNAIMGSFAFKAFVSHVIRVTKPKKDSPIRMLTCDTQRNGGVETGVSLVLTDNPLMYKKQSPDMPKGMAETVYKFIKARKHGASSKDFFETHQTPISTVNRAVISLKKSGHIEKIGKKGKGEVIYGVVKGKDL